jgi:Tfp pilus assembly protein PilE
MLSKMAKFMKRLKNLRNRKGFTLVEAATVVAIMGAMAIVTVPIASDKIEDSKIATAGATTNAIATTFVKFFGDTANFPIAKSSSSISGGAITGDTVKILRSGLSGTTIETTNNLDPDLPSGTTAGSGLGLWDTVKASGTATTKADAGTGSATNRVNLNEHLVSDDVGYGNGGVSWFGPYIPAVDQDPWGRNYLAYVAALDPDNLRDSTGKAIGEAGAGNVFVPRVSAIDTSRIYCWIISAGPDEKLQTAPTHSIIMGDDIGTIVAIPPVIMGAD